MSIASLIKAAPVQLRASLIAFCALALVSTVSAQTESMLHNFTSATGAQPGASVVADHAGNLYGTTTLGGPANAGVVYKLNSSGGYSVLYAFKGGSDGSFPSSSLTMDAVGNLYGTTNYGGSGDCGTVFKVDPSGRETVLYTFGCGTDGAYPTARVVFDSAGNLYGTVSQGGTFNWGAVFRLDLAGHETVLYNFTGGADGARPFFGVTLDPAGNLYGLTSGGGVKNGGVAYKLDPGGQETVLRNFPGGPGGAYPYGDLLRDAHGNLYGVTLDGGAFGLGLVFKLDSGGNETVLHSFQGPPNDVSSPSTSLAGDSVGNLFGISNVGGALYGGGIFKIDAVTHQESVSYTFPNSAYGDHGNGPLLIANGSLYGTQQYGGAFGAPAGDGLIFKVAP